MKTVIRFPVRTPEYQKGLAKQVRRDEGSRTLQGAKWAIVEYLKFLNWNHPQKTVDGGMATQPPTIETTIETPVVLGHTSLKVRAAVKEAIRLLDITPFDELPSFAEPSTAWLLYHEGRVASLSDEEKRRLFEEDFYGHLTSSERFERRRVKLGDKISKEMAQGAGIARLYKSEHDYFSAAVYGVTPPYWDKSFRGPTGSEMAKRYFDANPAIRDAVISSVTVSVKAILED